MANSKDLGRAGTSTFALKNRPRATRAMVAKVRTGCITCKRRHVKCDENKPACHRCLKWRGECQGYEERLSNQSRVKQESDTKRSESQESEVAQPSATGPSEQIPQWYPALANETMKLLSRPSDLLYASSPQASQSSSARPVSVPNLPSAAIPQNCGLEGAFWIKTVPALLRANASVRLANLAIHALIDSKRPHWVEEGPSVPGNDSYSRALKYHGQALSYVREKPASRESLQSATLCCLFFIIFEMMNGDVNAAQAHMYNGCRMMDELRGGSSNRPSTHGIENMLFRELQKALRFVAMQMQGAISGQSDPSDAPIKLETGVTPEATAAAAVSNLEVETSTSVKTELEGVFIKEEP